MNAQAALPQVQVAHNTMIAALAGLKPSQVVGHTADRFDIMARAEHLDAVLAAVTTYVKAIVADTAYMAPIDYIADETGYLADAASEIRGALNSGGDRGNQAAPEGTAGSVAIASVGVRGAFMRPFLTARLRPAGP